MKNLLLSAFAASAVIAAAISPTHAQFTPAEAVARASAMPAQTFDPNGPIAVQKRARRDAVVTAPAAAGARPYEALIASHAAANGVPVELVHRVIVRESRYRANAMGRGGATGLMQIKLATARGMGYRGTAAGLLDPETNLTYGVRYLAGAYRVANGHHGRAVGYYASGYYYAAKRQRARSTNAYAKTFQAPAPSIFSAAASAEPGVVMQGETGRKRR